MSLNHKLPVSLPEICAPRDELLQIFDNCAKKQYISIQAPAGYGKTVSTLLWLTKRNYSFAWFSLDEYDNSPRLFYRSLCRQLLALIPQNDAFLELLNNPSFAASPVESAIDLLSLLTWPEEKYSLVLDDLHTITNEEILKSLPFVLKRLPLQVNVLLLSRTALPEAMAVIKEKTAFIGSEPLALTSEEIQKHYASFGLIITQKEANDIYAYTGGWMIILNAIAISGYPKFSDINLELSLVEFFEKNFWNNFDKSMRDFLMKTAVVDSFTVKLCEKLTKRTDSAEILETLIQGNVNLSRLDDEYRYHDLFLEFLRKKTQESTLDISALYRLTAEYFINKNDVIPARQFAVRSGDQDTMVKATRMINLSKNVNLDEYVSLTNILKKDQLPDALCDAMPFLYLQKVYVSYLLGKHRDFEYYWDKIYGLFPLITDKFPQFMEANVTNCIIDYRFTFAEYAKRVRAMPAITYKNEMDQVSSIGINMPFLHRSSRDCYELTDESLREEVVDLAFRDLLKYDCDNLFLGIQAGLYIEQNRLDEARNILIQSEQLLNEKVSIDLGWATYIMLAETALLKDDLNEYERYKTQARDYFQSRKAFYYHRNYTAYETRTKLWNGDENAASKWLSLYFVGDSEYGVLYKIYQNFTTARSYIVLNNSGKALSALNEIKAAGKVFNRPLDTAEANVLTAIVEWITGKKKEARDRLHILLKALHPYGFIRIVANEGKAVLPILSAVIKKTDKEPDKDEALYKFVREVYVVAYEQSKRFKGLTHSLNLNPVKLSPKQNLVLELLSKGHNNAEIVKLTGLSLNTIKTHTKIAYQKLDVTNALDAIVEAKRLGIIK